MTWVLFGLGANLGRPRLQLKRAVRGLEELVRVDRVSSVYRTEPVGFHEQPDFCNAVVVGETGLSPDELLAGMQRIERALGRVRTFPNAPRTIDIDLLDWGGGTRDGHELVLPHPRLHERAFVLVPLAEVAPEWRHPMLGLSAAELLARLGPHERVEKLGAL